MIHKSIAISQTPDEAKAFEAKYGSYNDAPPGFIEISEGDIALSGFAIFPWEYQEYRQIVPAQVPGEKYYLGVRLFYMADGNGFGMSFDHHHRRVRWFKFTVCEHQMELHGPQYMHLRTTKCTKCGWVATTDSSG